MASLTDVCITEHVAPASTTRHVDASGKRITGGGKWNPLYFTKRYDGLEPSQGGYPSDRDVRYPFDFAAAFRGQPGAGSPHHCAIDAPIDTKIQTCPKIVTKSDDHPLFGPGHIPPNIAVRSVRDAALECGADTASWFDFDKHRCDISPNILLKLIRKYYPRDAGGDVYYPGSAEAGPAFWEYEFPDAEGQAHWCGEEYRATGQYADFCPYVHEGPNAGKYRHPHIAFAALQQHLAHLAMPQKCGTEWDDRGSYPTSPDTSWAWVQMVNDSDPRSQPAVPYKHNPMVTKYIAGDLLLSTRFGCGVTVLVWVGDDR